MNDSKNYTGTVTVLAPAPVKRAFNGRSGHSGRQLKRNRYNREGGVTALQDAVHRRDKRYSRAGGVFEGIKNTADNGQLEGLHRMLTALYEAALEAFKEGKGTAERVAAAKAQLDTFREANS